MSGFAAAGERIRNERETPREEAGGQTSERWRVVLVETVLEARRHIELGVRNLGKHFKFSRPLLKPKYLPGSSGSRKSRKHLGATTGSQRALYGLELLRLAHGEHLAAPENQILNRVSKTRRAENFEPSDVSHAVLLREL